MEKRLLLSIVLSLTLLYVWNRYVMPSPVAPNRTASESVSGVSEEISRADIPRRPHEAQAFRPDDQTLAQNMVWLEDDQVKWGFSPWGGVLAEVVIRPYGERLPVTEGVQAEGFKQALFHVKEHSSTHVVFELATPEGRWRKVYAMQKPSGTLKVTVINVPDGENVPHQKFNVPDENFSTRIGKKSLNVPDGENVPHQKFNVPHQLSDITLWETFTLDVFKMDVHNSGRYGAMLQEYAVAFPDHIVRKRNASKFSPKEDLYKAGDVQWVFFRNRYFTFIVDPDFSSGGYRVVTRGRCGFWDTLNDQWVDVTPQYPNEVSCQEAERLRVAERSQGRFSWMYDLTLMSEVISREINTTNQGLQFTLYAGPQDIKQLEFFDRGWEKIVDFSVGGFFDIMAFGLTDAIAKIILHYVHWLHAIVRNWGLAIVLLSLTLFGLTYPLTLKSMTSMRKMQAIQPEVKRIQDKYQNNPQKLQKELAQLWKEHKINPMAGCLPMFLQMPIFVSLYQLLWRSYIFKGAGFLWIKDLSEPDHLFKFPVALPMLGEYFNLLPILYVVVMALQQRLSAKNTVAADPQQAAQQKLMMTFMPVFLGFVFYNFASGLTLYFTVFYTLSTLAQLKLARNQAVEDNADPE